MGFWGNDQFRKMGVKKKEEQIVVPKKAFLHAALIRNDFYVPDLNAPITTKRFLLEVRTEVTFAFGIKIIQKLPCPSPPPLHVLNNHVIKNLEKALATPGIVPDNESWKRLILHLKARQADKVWCIEILSTLA